MLPSLDQPVSISTVIFDCDGVLFRSEAANIAFYNAVLERVGEPRLDDIAEVACHTLASAQLFEKYFGERPAVLAQIREAAAAIDYAPFYPLMYPRDGLVDVLKTLGRRRSLGLATNRGKTVHGVLEYFGIAPYFDVALGVLDVERPKPQPDLLLECLRRLESCAQQAVYVGDQLIDAEAARAAGMRFIGIGPAVADATLTISELTELESLLEGL